MTGKKLTDRPVRKGPARRISADQTIAGTPGGSSKGSARREEILRTLAEKIARLELRNLTLREIGRALDIEPAHILYYFSSREALLQSVIVRWDDESRRISAQTPNSLDNLAKQVRRNVEIPGIVHLYLNFAAEAVDPSHAAHPFFKERFQIGTATLAERIRLEQAKGLISMNIDPEIKARQLIAMADGLQLQSLVNADIDAAADLQEAISSLRK